MSITGKDSLFEASAGVALTAHTPSGAGARGTAWALATADGPSSPVSFAGGGFNGSAGTGYAYLSGVLSPADDYVECVVVFTADSYAGVGLYLPVTTGAGGQCYQFMRWAGSSWRIVISGGTTLLATSASPAIVLGHPYLMRLERTISGGIATLTAYLDGVQVCQATDSTYLGPTAGGIAPAVAGANVAFTAFETGTIGGTPPAAGTLAAVRVAAGSVGLTLTAASGGVPPYSHQLQRSPAGAGTWADVGDAVTWLAPVFLDLTATPSTAHDYRAVVTDAVGDTDASNTVSVTTPSVRPAPVKVQSGLLYQSDGTLSGWSGPGDWTSAADPAFVTFGNLPTDVLGPTGSGAGSEVDGVREGQLYIESGVYYLLYDAGDHVNGWREYMALSADRGVTWARQGPTPEGYARATGGTFGSYATGWLSKWGDTYIRDRVGSPGAATAPNDGLPNGPYIIDSWRATSLDGPWAGFYDEDGTAGQWDETNPVPGSAHFDGSTYHWLATGDGGGTGNFGRYTSTTPTGARTRVDPAMVATGTTPGIAENGVENVRAFFHSGLNVYVALLNIFHTAADASAAGVSASLTDWSAATWRRVQFVSAMDGENAVGVMSHLTGPDGALVYDDDSGIVPFVYDGHATGADSGWHLGRKVLASAMEPSAACLRYATTGDSTVRRLARPLVHTSVVAEFAVEVTGGSGQVGVDVLCATGGATGYRVALRAGNTLSCAKLVGGSPTATVSGTGAVAKTTNFVNRVKVSVAGGEINAWLNGELQLEITDSSYASGAEVALHASQIGADVRCLSLRSSDVVTVTGLPDGATALVRGYGSLPAGAATGSGAATFTHTHYPLYSLDIDGTEYPVEGGLWGGDTLSAVAFVPVVFQSSCSGSPFGGSIA